MPRSFTPECVESSSFCRNNWSIIRRTRAGPQSTGSGVKHFILLQGKFSYQESEEEGDRGKYRGEVLEMVVVQSSESPHSRAVRRYPPSCLWLTGIVALTISPPSVHMLQIKHVPPTLSVSRPSPHFIRRSKVN